MNKKCKICSKKIVGRSDKIFCSVKCKNYYHINLRRVTDKAVESINKKLHRNRAILLEIMGKYQDKLTIDRKILEDKKFQFTYHTHFHINKEGKMYRYVYDFSWMEFSNDQILIVKTKNQQQ